MKKLLISILIILLIILAYFTVFEGLSLGQTEILSVEQIIEANDKLTQDIELAKSLLEKDYPTRKEELSASVTELLTRKEEYFNLAKISTEGEISKANTQTTYLREYLWVKVGNHATSKGVNIRMDVISGDTVDAELKNINFTANGHYIGIINFVSALENDSNLEFKIENFRMIKSSENLTATFTVRNVRIKQETASSNSQTETGANQNAQNDQSTAQTNNKKPSGSKFDQVTGTIEDALATE